MSDLKKIDLPEILRQLTYLQLCVVPSFIEPYLSRLTPHEIKCTLFLYMQTFFGINGDLFRSSCTLDLQLIVRQSCSRHIGKQMVHLLKTTLAYYIKNDYPLHTFFLDFDQNTEPYMIQLQKVLLKEISYEGKYRGTINIIMIALDIALELFEIKRGNGKYLLNFNGKNQHYQQQLQALTTRKKIHQQFIADIYSFQKSFHQTKNLRDLSEYCLNLTQCYQFVVLQQSQKQVRPQNQIDLLSKQRVQLQVQKFQSELSDHRFWFLTNESDTFEMISINFISILKNFGETSLNNIEKLKNSLIVLINKTAESKNDSEIQFRVDAYTLLLSIKLIYTLKNEKNHQEQQSYQLQDSFKQIMQLQIASIRYTFYFLAAFLQLDIQTQALYVRIVKLIGWVMSQYRKYSFKNQQLIYADFITSSLDLLVYWKQSQKEEDEKHIQTVLNRLSSKSKNYGQYAFSLFFQTLNPKIFEYVTVCLRKCRVNPIISLKATQNPNQVEILLHMFQDNINKYIFPTYPQLKQKSKQLEVSESTLAYVYQIYFNNYQKSTKEDIVFMRLYSLIRSILVSGKNQLLRNQIIQFSSLKCLGEFTKLIVKSINNLQIEYSVSQSKKNQGNITNMTQNPENQNGILFVQKSIRPLIFLNMLLFAFNPNTYKICFLHALILDSYCIDQSMSEIILNVYNNSKIANHVIWQEDQILLLEHSRRYDSLELFYENILLQSTESEKEKASKIAAFKRFAKQWCSEQTNYQWLSDQKASRIRLYSLKNFCLKIQSEIDFMK